MSDAVKSGRTERLEALCWLAFAAAITPNTIDAFANPSGDWWQPLRVGLSGVFVVALLALLASRLADRGRP